MKSEDGTSGTKIIHQLANIYTDLNNSSTPAQPNQPSTDVPPKKTKRKRFVWPEELHTKFMATIFDVGLSSAKPKQILKLLEPTPEGLTTEHIKSHLQKYRANSKKTRELFYSQYDIAKKQTMNNTSIKAINPTFHAYPIPTGNHIVSNTSLKRKHPSPAVFNQINVNINNPPHQAGRWIFVPEGQTIEEAMKHKPLGSPVDLKDRMKQQEAMHQTIQQRHTFQQHNPYNEKHIYQQPQTKEEDNLDIGSLSFLETMSLTENSSLLGTDELLTNIANADEVLFKFLE
eukprot:snap_masked-scaffold_11-processed-gene-1.23-mRNA-1 protein AED:0.34 eAED:0.34 QI:0/-1/0/1/-1/1/1/0/286